MIKFLFIMSNNFITLIFLMFAICLERCAFNSEKDRLALKEPTANWWRHKIRHLLGTGEKHLVLLGKTKTSFKEVNAEANAKHNIRPLEDSGANSTVS